MAKKSEIMAIGMIIWISRGAFSKHTLEMIKMPDL